MLTCNSPLDDCPTTLTNIKTVSQGATAMSGLASRNWACLKPTSFPHGARTPSNVLDSKAWVLEANSINCRLNLSWQCWVRDGSSGPQATQPHISTHIHIHRLLSILWQLYVALNILWYLR